MEDSSRGLLFLYPRSGTHLLLALLEVNEKVGTNARLPILPTGSARYQTWIDRDPWALAEDTDLLVVHDSNAWTPEQLRLHPEFQRVGNVIRDGRNCVASWYALPREHLRKDWFVSESDHKRFEQFCLFWQETARIITQQQAAGLSTVFRFEELVSDPVEGLRQVLQYYGWNIDRPVCTRRQEELLRLGFAQQHGSFGNREGYNTRWHRWESWQREMFCEIAGPELIAFNYESDNTWVTMHTGLSE